MKNRLIYILGIVCLLAISSCNKEVDFHSDPYETGKPALGITMEPTQKPTPELGGPGTVVKIKVSGLMPYKDKVIFNFNGQKAEIVSITDSEITVKVPEYASSGTTSLSIDDIIIFGPNFDVKGKVMIDPSWQALIGTNNYVNNYFFTPDEKMIFVGSFTNYENRGLIKPINRILRTYKNGMYDASWRTGTGSNGSLSSIIQIADRYYISGGFSGYDQRRDNISNLTKIHLTGQIDTMPVKPFRRPDQSDTTKYYPRFNGGFDGYINKIYEQEGKLLVTGNFRYYIKRIYGKPNFMETRDSVILDSTRMTSVARLKLDGTLDSSFRFQGTEGLPGANGNINTYYHTSGTLKGKLLVFGEFTRFDNASVGFITRLNPNGLIDPTFNAGGAGANFKISSATYNETTGKYVLTGSFRTYNGTETPKMVVLKSDGTIDSEFKVKSFGEGYPNFAKQLKDGLIVVSGNFIEYNGVVRKRFMILDSKGNLAQGLNTTGELGGSLSDVIETKSEDGRRALLLIGGFSKFEKTNVQNIVRIVIE